VPAGLISDVMQGHIDLALSNFAVKYRNQTFLAELLFPRVPVAQQSGLYPVFGRESQVIYPDLLRAPGAAAVQLKQIVSRQPYFANCHSAARLMPEEERANFQFGDYDEWVTQMLVDALLVDLENQVASLANNAANYPTGNKVTLSGTAQWSDLANSNPIKDVTDGIVKLTETGQTRFRLFLGVDVWSKLKIHPKITERVAPSKIGSVSTEDLAAIFEVEAVHVGLPVSVTLNPDGSVASTNRLWNAKNAILAFVNPEARFGDVSFGKLFVWASAPGTVNGFQVLDGPVSPASSKAVERSVHWYYDLRITSAISGYLIQNAVA
jgi:hypothetical protein